ncbi:hypothetical protein GPALN_008022 [Globodera pallida]|nr:hypothetical protein GPALN_008022 [Globodera pallida]
MNCLPFYPFRRSFSSISFSPKFRLRFLQLARAPRCWCVPALSILRRNCVASGNIPTLSHRRGDDNFLDDGDNDNTEHNNKTTLSSPTFFIFQSFPSFHPFHSFFIRSLAAHRQQKTGGGGVPFRLSWEGKEKVFAYSSSSSPLFLFFLFLLLFLLFLFLHSSSNFLPFFTSILHHPLLPFHSPASFS